MGYSTSVTPDISETIPAAFSSRLTAALPTMRDIGWDVSIQGLGFNVDPDGQPYTLRGSYIRQSVAVQKTQQDTSKEPGEQTLDGLWIRSQNSWHRGAGITFYEPGAEPDTEYRFAESSGIDVWTKGQVSSLHKTSLAQAATGVCYVQDAGNGYLVYLSDTAILGWGASGSYTLATPPAGINGRYYFFGYQKYIKVGWVSPASATVGIWNGGTDTIIAKNATVEPLVWYLKDRLIVAEGANLFEVPLNTASANAIDLSLASSALYTPTDAGTIWLDATEGPNAIYAAWTDGTRSGIVQFTLTNASSGQSPKLSQGFQVLSLPAGEQVRKIYGYLGRFLLVSTTRGLRVCAIDSNGNLIMGQLMIETTDAYTAFAGWGNYVYVGGANVPAGGTTGTGNLAGWGTASGVIRVNLGEPIGDVNNLVFAYATDLRSDVTGTVRSLAFSSTGLMELSVDGSGIWRESTTPVSHGYLAMGKVRYDTTVPKIYRSVETSGTMGADSSFTLQILDELDRPYYSVTMDATTGIFPDLMLDLTRTFFYVRPIGFVNTVTTVPVLNLIALKAWPAPGRIRQIRMPLRCDDVGQDHSGNQFGYQGFAFDRLSALEALEETGLPVTVVDNRTGETFTGTIDEIQYHNVVSPDRNYQNFGGHITVTFTKLA